MSSENPHNLESEYTNNIESATPLSNPEQLISSETLEQSSPDIAEKNEKKL